MSIQQTRNHSDIALCLSDLEKNHIDSSLSGELKQIYKTVQKNCENFRDKIFSTNVDILSTQIVRKIISNNIESMWSY